MSVYYSCKPFFLFLKFSGIFMLRLVWAVGIWHIWEPVVWGGGGWRGSVFLMHTDCFASLL